MPRFIPRERKHRKIARTKQSGSDPANTNTNSEEILPESRDDRETRRAALRQELRDAQPESKSSSKKRKRLEKYIDTKLKKDENAALLKRLEAQKVDTSLLQSSKKLGRVTENKREKLQRALREHQAGLPTADHTVLFEARAEPEEALSDDDIAEIDQEEPKPDTLATQPSNTGFGSGLKRPLDLGEDGRPVIQKRKRRKKNKSELVENFSPPPDDSSEVDLDADSNSADSEEEWEGFGSTDEEEETGSDHSDSESIVDSSDASSPPSRDVSGFKAWTETLRNAAYGFTPSTAVTDDQTMKAAAANFKPRVPSPDPVLESAPKRAESTRPATAVTVPRADDIQSARMELPVLQEEQKIMEAIHNNPVVVICGATGSGKTTQVPQMLFESGYAGSGTTMDLQPSGPKRGMIGVTQPRRVAATSVANRVSHELGSAHNNKVAHQVRYDTSVNQETAIKFMTDGILLREIQQDFILSKYSVIVVDEAHERSVNTDLLIGLLSRIVPLRADLAKEQPEKYFPLKLVIMSATLSHGVDSFLKNEKLWGRIGGPPPVVEAEGRQYPVTVHFSRKTRRDYVSEIVEKVIRGHRKLPPGGMLVFLTGQQEITAVAKKLRDRIGGSGIGATKTTNDNRIINDWDDYEDGINMKGNDTLEGEDDPADSGSEGEIDVDDEFDIEPSEIPISNLNGNRTPLKPHVLPLYAALPAMQQLKVFQPTPEGYRSIILATNVAETSLTIPGVRYVFDSGRVKEKRYDISSGVQTFEVDWTSKASAEQRKGRAGRTGPGHVWRLYSSAVYEEFFAEETVPEILRTPLESTILQLKAMEIDKVVNFPFPTSPDKVQLQLAEQLLVNLGAIAAKNGAVTATGKQIMRFPVNPRFGKMVLLALRNQILGPTIALVAGLAVGDLIIPEVQRANFDLDEQLASDDDSQRSDDGREQERAEKAAHVASQQRHSAYSRAQATLSRWDDRSDAVKILTAVAIHADAQYSGPLGTGASAVCGEFSLREKSMDEVQMLRRQLHNLVGDAAFEHKLGVQTNKELAILNQVAAGGFVDQVAIRTDMLKGTTGFGRKPRRAIEVPYRTLIPSMDDAAGKGATPQETEILRSVFVHSSSVLARLSVKEMPQFIIYSHLSRATPSSISSSKTMRTRMHPLTTIGPKALAVLAENTPLLQVGKPVGKIEDLARGEDGRQRRQCWVSVSLRAPSSASTDEWPLGAWKVVQKRGSRDWEIEKVIAR